jgi:ribosomal protein S18 acetylase RimI-like enzyme
MVKIEIKRIDATNQEALRLPNEAFPLFGRLVVERVGGAWQQHEELFSERTTQTFPDENYQLADIDAAGFALGAFSEGKCVGLATFEDHWNKYLYLDDLKVNQALRGQRVATQLLDAAGKIAREHGCHGLTTICQDNNLGANRFYLHYGFKIGGLNTEDYHFTSQNGKFDIYYYYNFV